MKIKWTALILFLTFSAYLTAELPISRQGTVKESVSASEMMVEATGIYQGQGKNDKAMTKDVSANGVSRALVDARRTAVYTVLMSGTDPLLKNSDEIRRYDEVAEKYYSVEALGRYITYEDAQLLKKVTTDGGRGIKVSKNFKVNRDNLYRDLVNDGILISREELADAIGNPVIMVLPQAAKGENPIALLEDPLVKHAASVVQSFLTARTYDVVLPEQSAQIQDLSSAQMSLEGRETDYAYELALSIGSDVYITFGGAVEDAGYGTQRYAMNINAYETTTARLLGTETGYSQGRRGEISVSVEEAMNDAVDKVLNRISNYWKVDMKRGIQFKLIVSISGDLDEDMAEEVQFALADAIDEVAVSSKENIVTRQTVDYLLWCDAGKYDKSSKVYRNIRKSFSDAELGVTLRQVNINRKLILLKVDP